MFFWSNTVLTNQGCDQAEMKGGEGGNPKNLLSFGLKSVTKSNSDS